MHQLERRNLGREIRDEKVEILKGKKSMQMENEYEQQEFSQNRFSELWYVEKTPFFFFFVKANRKAIRST